MWQQITQNSSKNLVKIVPRKIYVDDFLKSVRTSQEQSKSAKRIKIFQIKWTKMITRDEEIKPWIPDAEKSKISVKILEAETKSKGIKLDIEVKSRNR